MDAVSIAVRPPLCGATDFARFAGAYVVPAMVMVCSRSASVAFAAKMMCDSSFASRLPSRGFRKLFFRACSDSAYCLGHRIGIRHSCQIQPDLITIDAILVARSAVI